MRQLILVYMFVCFTCLTCFAQTDSVAANPPDTAKVALRDSATLARQHFVEDSLTMLYLKAPNPARYNVFIDTALKLYAPDLYRFSVEHNAKTKPLYVGKSRALRPVWIVAVILFLLVYLGVLNLIIGKDIYGIIQAFYSKKAFAYITNDENLLTSWTFVGLFTLFGLTMGLYLYQVVNYYHLSYDILGFDVSGFQLYFTLSVAVLVLFIIKIFVLRLIGFVFDIGHLVKEYISILYLTYFNVAFIFLPIVALFGLLSSNFKPYLLAFSMGAIIIILTIQYLRTTVNIISKFRFQKIYLFIYLCALEICPILILIKALDL